jgi:hypothetical protein
LQDQERNDENNDENKDENGRESSRSGGRSGPRLRRTGVEQTANRRTLKEFCHED